MKRSNTRYRSLFWPIILVGVGLIWLLGNLGILTGQHMAVAFQLWPVLLVVAGVDLIFGRRSRTVGASVGLATVALFILLMLIGPSLGLGADLERKTETFTVARDDTTAYSITIDAGVDSIIVDRLVESRNLLDATIHYVGEINFEVEGTDERNIEIEQGDINGVPFGWFDFGDNASSERGWIINLDPTTPLELDISGGIGSVEMTLTDMQLRELDVDMGVGEMLVRLPEPTGTLNVKLDGGIGSATVIVPEGVAVQLNGSSGVGSIDVRGDLARQGSDEADFISVEGMWQTANFDAAEDKIIIKYDGGIGSLEIR